ncbi:MAG: GNAT family N-acetyltransferase [Anaerolineales bacterium]|nr:GNAT family N-acetyltransferase [Anaerolineales bacterium]
MTEVTLTAPPIRVFPSPDIPGLSFRGFRGEPDYPVMAEIINAANLVDQIEDIATVESVARSYRHIRRSDIETDMLFAEVDGNPIGYGRCMWAKVQDGDGYYTYSFFLHLHPDWRRKGIGEAMAAHLINRIKEISHQHPSQTEKFIQAWGSDTQVWWDQLITTLGFTPIRYGILMTRPCSQPVDILPLPEGVEIRPVEDNLVRQIFNAIVESFQDHWNFVEPDEKDFIAWQDDPDFDPSLWVVAWDGDQVVGTVLNYINKEENQNFNRKRGYTENICTRRPWRRQGIARALLTHSIRMFQEMGMEETALGVDTENTSGALNLYQDVGYRETRRHITYRKPMN